MNHVIVIFMRQLLLIIIVIFGGIFNLGFSSPSHSEIFVGEEHSVSDLSERRFRPVLDDEAIRKLNREQMITIAVIIALNIVFIVVLFVKVNRRSQRSTKQVFLEFIIIGSIGILLGLFFRS